MIKFRIVISLLLLSFFSVFSVFASTNVIDVQISENVYQSVKYNPLGPTSGLWADAGETQSIYTVSGTIVVLNAHATESISDVVVNFSSIANIYNLIYSSGAAGTVNEFNISSDSAVLFVPDLGAGQNATFTYSINTTIIAPPLNLTANFSSVSVLSGLDFGVTDNIQNVMNASEYTDTCIYNIEIIQNTLGISQAGSTINFTYDDTSLSGSDATNASITPDNRTLNWDLWNLGCFESTNTTDISYSINAPGGILSATDYEFMNSSISYAYNSTISQLALSSVVGITDLELNFDKYQVNILDGDNATWRITSEVLSQSDITVNLTTVTLWVSQRNGTGTGFTNPSLLDNDTVSGAVLQKGYTPNVLMNSTTAAWDNSGTDWFFNYTYSSSPIVWMDLENRIVDDGVQLINSSVTSGDNETYVKELYVATGYWLEITKNITRLGEANYSVLIKVVNLGSWPTPADQAVVIYNFLPNTFALESTFSYSPSPWYNTSETNTTLNDPTYNGTMYQYALIANGNPTNSSLDVYGGSENVNNTWTVTYNISGSGEFKFDDLFLTGVDPLNVQEVGATKAIATDSSYKILSASLEYLLVGVASVVGLLILLI